MAKTETLSIDLLRLDCDTQSRIEVHQDTVDEYSELITANKAKWPFPPLTVYHDGTSYFPADGFHRILGAAKAGRASIPCDVKTGTARDARFFGMKANDEHGLRMSRDDRRKNVIWMLENYPEMTQENIAANAGVSTRTVGSIVADRKPQNRQIADSETSATGVPSTPATSATPTKDAAAKAKAAKAKAKAKAAAAKEKDKAAKEKAKLEAAAAKEKARIEAAGARQKIKDDAAEAKAEAKAAKEAAKAASLTTDGQIKNIKNLIQQHIGKLVRHLADLHRLKPNRSAFDASKKACEGIKTW